MVQRDVVGRFVDPSYEACWRWEGLGGKTADMESQPPSTQPPMDPNAAFSGPLPPPPGQPQQPSTPTMPPMGAMPPRGPMPPMPPMMPPVYPMYPMPPAPRGSGFVRTIFMTLAGAIFSISLMLNLYLLLFAGLVGGGSSSRTNVVMEGDPKERVAVVALKGLIMDEAFERFDHLLTQVQKDKAVKAVVIEIDSPGGTVSASDLIYNRIIRFKVDRPGLPVVVSMGSLATSGGYYAACASDYIVAQRSTLTGNIGVLMPQYNLSGLMQTIGVTETTIQSTGARFKNAGSMFRPVDAVETKYFQDLIDQAFVQFKAVVRDGRSGKLTKPMDEIANGKVYSAQDAVKLGLVDKVGYLEDAINQAATIAGMSKPNAIRYQQTPTLRDVLMGAESKLNAPEAGMTLHISPQMMDEFTRPRLMYLWRAN